MSGTETLLSLLQTKSHVDCDTLDNDVVRKFTDLVDCTSNQAIAYTELAKQQYQSLLKRSVARSKQLHGSFKGISQNELAVELAMVELSLQMASGIKGMVHMQTNPYHAYDKQLMVADALRLVSLYKTQSAEFDTSRVCIKIPSTFEGLQACKVLNAPEFGLNTLATTVFTIEQAVLAADAECHYIAPYVNAMARHEGVKFQEPSPDFQLCVSAQRFFEKHGSKTKVLAASFHSTDEIMKLSGIHHLTIPPALLEKLRNLPSSTPRTKPLLDEEAHDSLEMSVDLLRQHDAFTKAISRANDKMSHPKAIGFFCDMQDKLEALVDSVRKEPEL